jgi:hypothetical protein
MDNLNVLFDYQSMMFSSSEDVEDYQEEAEDEEEDVV